jgi:hypothetical protein
MTKNYTQEELNQILLEKNLSDFYLSIIENRKELLTDEEYEDIVNSEKTISGDNKEEVENLIDKIQNDERIKNYVPDFMKFMYSFAQVRHLAILTMIDDNVYDIGNIKFVDLRRNKIIDYSNLANYYDDTNARLRVYTPAEDSRLKQDTVLVDVDDESIAYAYEEEHIHQKNNEDLTSEFLSEVKSKPYGLRKTK